MAAVVKFAQGSSTVAIITTAGIMSAIISTTTLPFHPIYLYLAIGYGAMVGSWMNDSGFWIVGKLSGMTEKQTLQTWTTLLAVIGIVGGIQALVVFLCFSDGVTVAVLRCCGVTLLRKEHRNIATRQHRNTATPQPVTPSNSLKPYPHYFPLHC